MVSNLGILFALTISTNVSTSTELAAKADKALAAVGGIAYFGTFARKTEPVDGGEAKIVSSKGQVIAKRNVREKNFGWQISLTTTLLGENHPQGAITTTLYDGRTMIQILPEMKRIVRMEGYDQPVTEDVRYWLFPSAFWSKNKGGGFNTTPFQKIVSDAKTASVIPTKIVNGVRCIGLRVIYASKQAGFEPGPSEYYFGKSDMILRKYATSFNIGKTHYSDHIDLVNVVLNPFVEPNTFTSQTPVGYEEKIVDWQAQMAQFRSAAATQATGLEVGSDAPDFKLIGIDGKEHSLGEFRGKTVLLDFYGTWCGPCNMAMPHHQKLYDELKDKGFVLIGVSCDEQPNVDVGKYMKERGCNYLVLLKGEPASKLYKVSGYPTVFVVNAAGKITYKQVGFSDEIEKATRQAVKKALGGN